MCAAQGAMSSFLAPVEIVGATRAPVTVAWGAEGARNDSALPLISARRRQEARPGKLQPNHRSWPLATTATSFGSDSIRVGPNSLNSLSRYVLNYAPAGLNDI